MKISTRLIISVLSSILVLLGFGGCKSCKKATKGNESSIERDTIRIVPPPPTPVPDQDPTRLKVVYGPPPSAYRDMK